MANRIFKAPQINLNPKHQRPLFVDMEAFFEFSFWMAEELSDLVERHEHQKTRSSRRASEVIAKVGRTLDQTE